MSVTKHINQLQFMIDFLEFSLIFINFRKKREKEKADGVPGTASTRPFYHISLRDRYRLDMMSNDCRAIGIYHH
jgi:hypothetical protein